MLDKKWSLWLDEVIICFQPREKQRFRGLILGLDLIREAIRSLDQDGLRLPNGDAFMVWLPR